MAPTFKRISLEDFERLLANFPFSRQINAIHMHHTWRPGRSDFKGHETIVSMWRHHTQKMGWSDIAQHITIDPEGMIWLGRNWNRPPASAAGHNGNMKFGPFMFEMIGNFDKGHDRFDGQQRETALHVIAMVQTRFNLAPSTLMFHNALSAKSCPGTSLEYEQILTEVEKRRSTRQAAAQASRGRQSDPFPDEADISIEEAIESLNRASLNVHEPSDAELSHDEQRSAFEAELDGQTGRGTSRDSGLSPEALAALRPHLINLAMGRFSTEGEAKSSAADVDAIFDEHLATAIEKAKADGYKLRIVFFAHGGLVSESNGLRIAAKHIDWWKENRIYPIYFIWETGLFETLGNLLQRAQQGATRGRPRDVWDYTLDPLIEVTARALQGPRIWGGMKSSAEHAVSKPTSINQTGGGAWYVANKLKAFCDEQSGNIELHAVGHSAGTVFHSYFLVTTHGLGVPTFASAHFLAPAVRVDTFKSLLLKGIGENKAVQKLTIFTMKKDYEKGDNCAMVYHKSLLYLIYYALEELRATPILGLEESLRSDAELKSLFGLGGAASPNGEVVWSVTATDSGASASTSRTHGGFDDDAPTMDSIARRILGKADADKIVAYRSSRVIVPATREWIEEVDWPEGLTPPVQAPAVLVSPEKAALSTFQHTALSLSQFGTQSGRRRALCVGINGYPTPGHGLAGCVADARMWADTLTRVGFTTSLLLDGQATREAISRELAALISGSHAGDVIVFQFAGHGTIVPDLDGDEDDGNDEAICPVNFAEGALYIDDDIADVIAQLPDGVNLTCFMDCCHSGTNSRFAVGVPVETPRPGRDERKRYIKASPELVEAHKRFRQTLSGSKRSLGTGGRSLMKDIKFSACLDSEVAWESDGHGEFTLRATRLITAGIDGLSNLQFVRRLTSDFGMGTRQHPMLDCAPASGSHPLLQPLNGNGAAGTTLAPTAQPSRVE